MISKFAETLDAALDQAHENGRSLRSVAEEVGISFPHLHDLRRDRRGTSPEVAGKLAIVLGIDAATFLGYLHERQTNSFFFNHSCPRCGYPHGKK